MKAEDLMVGDLLTFGECVNDKDYPVIKVTGILEDILFACIGDSKGEDAVCYEDLAGIPLTPEILEKNGFICNWWWKLSGEEFWLNQSGDAWRAYTDGEADKRDNFCWITYVHELQHALKLCGINLEIKV